VGTTLEPTERLIQKKAHERQKRISTTRYLAGAAFDALMAGNAEEHDRLLKSEISRARAENDVVVLAQGSMARLIPMLEQDGVPVLSSPRMGLEALKERLGL
jgi:N-formylglutamate amidohydrolase